MYIPLCFLIIGVIIVYWLYRNFNSVEGIERGVVRLKKNLFELVHFDSPQFLDYQNSFDAMKINYLRLKQRFIHSSKKVLEIAKDWERYVIALGNLKYARIMYDVDWNDDVFEKTDERRKEPEIIIEEIEKKFKKLLGKDWKEIPPNYSKRKETANPDIRKKDDFQTDGWKVLYMGEKNFVRMEEERQKEKEKKKQGR